MTHSLGSFVAVGEILGYCIHKQILSYLIVGIRVWVGYVSHLNVPLIQVFVMTD